MADELFREDAYRQSCSATVQEVAEGAVLLDRTVFYARGGGQPGDRGRLVLPGGDAVAVTDARRDAEGSGRILHSLAADGPCPAAGTAVTAALDWPRRYRLMRMHSALHLLCRAVEAPVTGGQIDDGKGRLDFDAGEVAIEREAIEERLRAWIAGDHAIRDRWIDEAELDDRPELVRTLSVRPPRGQGRVRLVEIEGVDLQACGGTHVRSTAEIGEVTVGKIESKGRHNRRVNLLLGS